MAPVSKLGTVWHSMVDGRYAPQTTPNWGPLLDHYGYSGHQLRKELQKPRATGEEKQKGLLLSVRFGNPKAAQILIEYGAKRSPEVLKAIDERLADLKTGSESPPGIGRHEEARWTEVKKLLLQQAPSEKGWCPK